MNPITSGYLLKDKYLSIINTALRLSPPGLKQIWGICSFRGGQDFRLNYGKYRVIGISPMAKHIAVLMEWNKIFVNRALYENDQDFSAFEDAHGYLTRDQNPNYPWCIWQDTDIEEPYVETFLESGMNLIVRELRRTHSK